MAVEEMYYSHYGDTCDKKVGREEALFQHIKKETTTIFQGFLRALTTIWRSRAHFHCVRTWSSISIHPPISHCDVMSSRIIRQIGTIFRVAFWVPVANSVSYTHGIFDWGHVILMGSGMRTSYDVKYIITTWLVTSISTRSTSRIKIHVATAFQSSVLCIEIAK